MSFSFLDSIRKSKSASADVRKAHSCIVCSDLIGATRQIDSFYRKIQQGEPGWGDDPDLIEAVNEVKTQSEQDVLATGCVGRSGEMAGWQSMPGRMAID